MERDFPEELSQGIIYIGKDKMIRRTDIVVLYLDICLMSGDLNVK